MNKKMSKIIKAGHFNFLTWTVKIVSGGAKGVASPDGHFKQFMAGGEV